jgi:hypothetical protein
LAPIVDFQAGDTTVDNAGLPGPHRKRAAVVVFPFLSREDLSVIPQCSAIFSLLDISV